MNLYASELQSIFRDHLYLGNGYGEFIDCNPYHKMLSIEESNGSHRISYHSIISIEKIPNCYIITTKMGKINCYFNEEGKKSSKVDDFFDILKSEVARYDKKFCI